MTALVLIDLRGWAETRMRKTIALAAILLAAAGLLGELQPLLLGLAGVAAFALAGWSEGKLPRSSQGGRPAPLTESSPPREVLGAKAVAALAIWLAILFGLSPILAASAIAWGLSAGTIGSVLLCWLAAYFTAASVSFCADLATSSEGLIGLFLYAPWLLSSFFITALKPSNPFIQIASMLRLEDGAKPYLGMAFESLAALALFALSGLILRGRWRRRHD